MRLRVFGVSRLLLLACGLLPLLVWAGFHPASVLYRREEWWWALGLGVLFSVSFMMLFRRGGFRVRWAWYGLVLWELLIEIVPAVLDRDFAKLLLALAVLVLMVVLGTWLERRVDSAPLNPRALWFEGDLKPIPRVSARVKRGDAWTEAAIRRIDERGLFLLQEDAPRLRERNRIEFELIHDGFRVGGEGSVVAYFEGDTPGFGLQFLPKDLYHFQQYTAWVRRLRGEGL
jgi:hypothetical protein